MLTPQDHADAHPNTELQFADRFNAPCQVADHHRGQVSACGESTNGS